MTGLIRLRTGGDGGPVNPADYDYGAVDADMARVYSDGTASGVEHMADCMADQMGAERLGTVDGRDYSASYGGECTPRQLEAAASVIAGHRP